MKRIFLKQYLPRYTKSCKRNVNNVRLRWLLIWIFYVKKAKCRLDLMNI